MKAIIGPGKNNIRYEELTQEEIDQGVIDQATAAARKAIRNIELLRIKEIGEDPVRLSFVDKLKTANSSQIDTYVHNYIGANTVTDLASAQTAITKCETAICMLLKLQVYSIKK